MSRIPYASPQRACNGRRGPSEFDWLGPSGGAFVDPAMRALEKKLLRDLLALKGQVMAIAVVIAAGVMTLMITVTTLDALKLTQQRFYDDYHFADVFADLKRAPESAALALGTIPGVRQMETRVRAAVRVQVPGFSDPVRGVLLSLPDGRQPALNRLYLRAGHLPESGRADQVLVSDAFAEAHGLQPGDRIAAIIRGQRTDWQIVGIALSPEFVYQISPTDLMPDPERYGIFWMNRRALASAYGMDGAFNQVVFRLQRGAAEAEVIAAIDRQLERHGGLGAYGREHQPSHRFLEEELKQLRMQTWIMPVIFLSVSGFLLYVVMSRIIRNQREQVAVLKAFGYDNREIGLHYAGLTAVIVLLGCAVGIVLGMWVGQWLAALYLEYFRFPALSFRLQPSVVLLAVTVAALAALVGTLGAVRKAARLPPAEGMRPESPPRFRQSVLERMLPRHWLGPVARIVLRNLVRQPVKAALSALGIALSAGLLVMGAYQLHAVDHMLDTQYRLVNRMDVHLTFVEPVASQVQASLRGQPGVQAVELYRSVPVRLVVGHREYRTQVLGLEAQPELRQLLGAGRQPFALPADGLWLTDYLARDLGLEAGDWLWMEIQEGARRTVRVQLAGVVEEPLGVGAYMQRPALNRLLREGSVVSGAWLLVDHSREDELYARLTDWPGVAGIGLIGEAESNIREYLNETLLSFAVVFVLLAGSITFAVVYNNARILFTERARELATLQVLGYSRAQVARILLGEILIITLLALPLGAVTGTTFAWAINQAFSMDLFRIPFIITPSAYGFAALVIVLTSLLASLLVLRRLWQLDKIAVLKAVE